MRLTIRLKGGAGSGFYGHKGRLGQEGGSLPRDNSQYSNLSDNDRRNWSINIVNSDLFKTLMSPDGYLLREHEELSSIMQQFPYGTLDKQEFVNTINSTIRSAERLPKAKVPSKNQRWVFETPDNQMPSEIMYYLQKHYEKHGSASQIVLPEEIREYSGGWLDERTLDYIYSESLRPYFNWEHMANLNQLRLKNEYVYSPEGISSKSAALGKSLKTLGLTPSQLYDKLINLRT